MAWASTGHCESLTTHSKRRYDSEWNSNAGRCPKGAWSTPKDPFFELQVHIQLTTIVFREPLLLKGVTCVHRTFLFPLQWNSFGFQFANMSSILWNPESYPPDKYLNFEIFSHGKFSRKSPQDTTWFHWGSATGTVPIRGFELLCTVRAFHPALGQSPPLSWLQFLSRQVRLLIQSKNVCPMNSISSIKTLPSLYKNQKYL